MARMEKSSRRFLAVLLTVGIVFSGTKLTAQAFTVKDADVVLENPDGELWTHSEITKGSMTFNINYFDASFTENELAVFFDDEDLYAGFGNGNSAKNNIFVFLNGAVGYGDFSKNIKATIFKDEESVINGSDSVWKPWTGEFILPEETPSGNDTSGNDTSGNDTSGNDPSGNDPSGNDPSGNDPSGNDPSGNNPIIEGNPIIPWVPQPQPAPQMEPVPEEEILDVSELVTAPVVKEIDTKKEEKIFEPLTEEPGEEETVSGNSEASEEPAYELVAKVIDEASVEKEDLKKIDEVLEEQKESNIKVLCYLDLSAYLEGINVTELTEPITITIEAPKDMVCGEGMEYVVIRVHEGETTILPVTVNDDGTLSFENDKFSAFALAIREILDEKPAKAETIESVISIVEQKEQNKKFLLWVIIVLGIAVVAGVASVSAVYRRKK